MEFREYAARETSALIDRLVSDAEGRTAAQVAGIQREHESALTSMRLQLEARTRELDARTLAKDQLTAAVEQTRSQLDTRRTEFEAQRVAFEAQRVALEAHRAALETLRAEVDVQRRLAVANASAGEQLLEARAALDVAQAESERRIGQFETDLEELRGEHVKTIQEQALARTVLPLDELLTVFSALATASTPSAVLTTVVSGLAREFSRVALFRLRGNRLECVNHVGFEFEGDIAKVVIPTSVDSLLTRAMNSRESQSFVSGSDEPCSAPFGGRPACAIALPLVSGDATVAVVYADDSDQLEFGSVPAPLLVKFAELVWQHAVLVLQHSSAGQKTLAVTPSQTFDRRA
jgi:hypothetical protein